MISPDGSKKLVTIETEVDSDRMDGLELLDDLIRTFHALVKSNIDKHFKTGDFIRMVDLRYKLSPTSAEQEKFWAMLAKIRRDTLNKSAVTVNPQESRESNKSARHGAPSAIGRIRKGE